MGVNIDNTRTTTYAYDDQTNTTTISRPKNVTETITRDSRGNIITTSKQVNNTQQTSRYRYNGLNKLAEATDALGNTTTYEYNNLGYQIARTVTDKQTGESHITRSEYNNLGWNTQTKDAEGRIFTSSYDAVGNVIDVVENGLTLVANGLRTTTNSYDKLNRKTQVTVTSGNETTIDNTTYDTIGNIISSIDAKGNPTTYKYDDLNRRTKVIDAKGQDTDYVYDEVGNLKEIIAEVGNLTDIIAIPTRKIVYTYDNLNRRTLVTDAEGIKTRSKYNEFGEVVAVTENADISGYRTTRYEYDKLGRKVKTIDTLNKETITAYDAADNVTSVTDANGNTISYVYDALNRRTQIIDANNITTQTTTYDGFGNVRELQDSGTNKTQYKYDKLDRLIKTIDPRGKESTQSYDGLGRVGQIKDRNNRTRTFGYDINDNLTTETWGNGIGLSFTYDKVGNLLSSTDGSSNTTNIYGYDDIYQLTSAKTSNSDVEFEYAYDEFGDKIQRLDVRNNTNIAGLSYTYNNNHQLRLLNQSGTGLATQRIEFAYDKLSQLARVKRWIGGSSDRLITDYGYDTVGRLTGITNQFNSTVISNYVYGYDDGSRLKTKGGSDGDGTVSYGRDNQISGVDYSSRPDESYDFNALGIRSGWVTDALDSRRVLSDGKYEFTYDNEGNLIERREISNGKLISYQWDFRNRLVGVVADGLVIAYGYDAEDRRVSKRINGVVKERYVYDGDDIALVVDAAGTIVERYLYGAGVDNVLSVERGNSVTWSLADRQGSVVDLVDEGGNVLNHFVYDSFGIRSESTSVGFRFGYTGRELDIETGLYYYRARYYDPSLGRFISEDPIGFGAGDTNLYRYVSNSPTNFTDPSGTVANVAAGAGLGAIFGGLYALANDIESGNFGWDTFGNVLKGAAVGAVAGAAFSVGLGVVSTLATQGLTAGFTAAFGANAAIGSATAGAIVNTSIAAGFTAYGAYNAGGNFGRGKYLTGALDLVGVAAGARNVFTGVTQGIPNARWTDLANAIDSLPSPATPSLLNSSGAIVPAQSSALANRTSVGGSIVPYSHPSAGALVLANSANSAITPYGLGHNENSNSPTIIASDSGSESPLLLNQARQEHEFYHGFSIRNVNPHTALAGGSVNCLNCAIAVDATLAGRPAQALPHLGAKNFGQGILLLEKTFGGRVVQSSLGDIRFRIDLSENS